jgi:hypothetical protein
VDVRRLRLVAGHAIGFARYWNRPMGSWRKDFLFQFAFMIVLVIQGFPYYYIGAFTFTLMVGLWTRLTIREYRAGKRPGNRCQHHDRNDIWKDGPHG